MIVTRLNVRNFRCIEQASLEAHPHINVIVGPNGAGKTTILEALHLMAYGRSFRGRPSEGLIRNGAAELEVFVEWMDPSRTPALERRAGLRHGGKEWTGRLDGQDVSQLGELCSALAVVTFEPESHQLVTGSADGRRRFMDWGLFHVEHRFLPIWRRYSRALKQRNALLKQHAPAAQLDAWDRELALSGTEVNTFRRQYIADIAPSVGLLSAEVAPSVRILDLEFSDGWRSDQMDLADALLMHRDRDRATGYTSVGPHRADFKPVFVDIKDRDQLSRGQAKLAALSVLLGQASHLSSRVGTPIIALDDVASELDANHQQRVFEVIRKNFHQIWVTATATPVDFGDAYTDDSVGMFHVEHGQVRR